MLQLLEIFLQFTIIYHFFCSYSQLEVKQSMDILISTGENISDYTVEPIARQLDDLFYYMFVNIYAMLVRFVNII